MELPQGFLTFFHRLLAFVRLLLRGLGWNAVQGLLTAQLRKAMCSRLKHLILWRTEHHVQCCPSWKWAPSFLSAASEGKALELALWLSWSVCRALTWAGWRWLGRVATCFSNYMGKCRKVWLCVEILGEGKFPGKLCATYRWADTWQNRSRSWSLGADRARKMSVTWSLTFVLMEATVKTYTGLEKRSYSPEMRWGASGASVDMRDILKTSAGRSSVLVVQLERWKGLESEDKLLFAF